EGLRGLRVVRPQALRVPPIDARIILLARNREREDLLLGEVPELPSLREPRNHESTSQPRVRDTQDPGDRVVSSHQLATRGNWQWIREGGERGLGPFGRQDPDPPGRGRAAAC